MVRGDWVRIEPRTGINSHRVRIEPGTGYQQSSVLTTELRCTPNELRCTPLSYAAPRTNMLRLMNAARLILTLLDTTLLIFTAGLGNTDPLHS